MVMYSTHYETTPTTAASTTTTTAAIKAPPGVYTISGNGNAKVTIDVTVMQYLLANGKTSFTIKLNIETKTTRQTRNGQHPNYDHNGEFRSLMAKFDSALNGHRNTSTIPDEVPCMNALEVSINEVTFTDDETGDPLECTFDDDGKAQPPYFELIDKKNVTRRFCNLKKSESIISFGDQVLAKFDRGNLTGFTPQISLKLKQAGSNCCGGVFYAKQDEVIPFKNSIVTSPNYPNPYPDGARCPYIFRCIPKSGKKCQVRLAVLDFQIEKANLLDFDKFNSNGDKSSRKKDKEEKDKSPKNWKSCSGHDAITISTSNRLFDKKSETYCNEAEPDNTFTGKNEVLLYFETNADTNDRGFAVTFHALDQDNDKYTAEELSSSCKCGSGVPDAIKKAMESKDNEGDDEEEEDNDDEGKGKKRMIKKRKGKKKKKNTKQKRETGEDEARNKMGKRMKKKGMRKINDSEDKDGKGHIKKNANKGTKKVKGNGQLRVFKGEDAKAPKQHPWLHDLVQLELKSKKKNSRTIRSPEDNYENEDQRKGNGRKFKNISKDGNDENEHKEKGKGSKLKRKNKDVLKQMDGKNKRKNGLRKQNEDKEEKDKNKGENKQNENDEKEKKRKRKQNENEDKKKKKKKMKRKEKDDENKPKLKKKLGRKKKNNKQQDEEETIIKKKDTAKLKKDKKNNNKQDNDEDSDDKPSKGPKVARQCLATLLNTRFFITSTECCTYCRYIYESKKGQGKAVDEFDAPTVKDVLVATGRKKFDKKKTGSVKFTEIQDVFIDDNCLELMNAKEIDGVNKKDIYPVFCPVLLMTKEEVKMTPKVSPICLPIYNTVDFKNKNAYSLGRGYQKLNAKGSESFMQASVGSKVLKDSKCQKRLGKTYLDKTMLCSVGSSKKGSMCFGDEGAPMIEVSKNGDGYKQYTTLLGILGTSGCKKENNKGRMRYVRQGTKDQPGEYNPVTTNDKYIDIWLDVRHYISWIVDVFQANLDDPMCHREPRVKNKPKT